jgi:hypothetical protein
MKVAYYSGEDASSATKDVRRLPMPKPDTAATTPARMAAAPSTQGDSISDHPEPVLRGLVPSFSD